MHRNDQHPQVGALLGELAGGLDAGQARHRDIEQRQLDLVAQSHGDRLLAVACLRHDLEVGLGVEDHPQTMAHERVIVGEQDARHRGTRESEGHERARGARSRLDPQLRTDRQRTLAHPEDTALRAARDVADAVVADGELDAVRVAAQRDLDRLRRRVADGVGEALLGRCGRSRPRPRR